LKLNETEKASTGSAPVYHAEPAWLATAGVSATGGKPGALSQAALPLIAHGPPATRAEDGDAVLVGVDVKVGVGVGVLVLVAVAVEVCDGVDDELAVTLGDAVCVGVHDMVVDGDADCVSDAGVDVILGVTDGDGV